MKVLYISQGCPLTIFFMPEKREKRKPIQKKIKKMKRHFMFIIFSQQILGGKVLLIFI